MMMALFRSLFAAAAVGCINFTAAAGTSKTKAGAPGTEKGGAGGSAVTLRPESELTSSCFGFPLENNFNRERSITGQYGSTPNLLLETGEPAIDFTLHDYPDGKAWNLRETLESGETAGKPVVLIWGMYTCPAFQGMGDYPPMKPWDMCGHRDEFGLVEMYKDRVTFVHLYGPEPHPVMPDTNFDYGVVVDLYWSTVPQPRHYDGRLAMVEKSKKFFHPEQVILPDYLPGNPYSDLIQPVWCSYGFGARPAAVIGPDGTIAFQQEWFHAGRMSEGLDLLLGVDTAPDTEE